MSNTEEYKLILLILNKTELIDDVITLFLELGIKGATVLESTGMAKFLSEDIPLFAGFREILKGARPNNMTIFSVVPGNIVNKAAAGLQDIIGNFNEPGNGLFFAIPISNIWGKEKIVDNE